MRFKFMCVELAKIKKNSNILHQLSHESAGKSVNWCHFHKGNFAKCVKGCRLFTLGIY